MTKYGQVRLSLVWFSLEFLARAQCHINLEQMNTYFCQSIHGGKHLWFDIRVYIMAGVSNGPVPTRLALLSDLPSLSPGSKVRFLGW